MNLGDGDIEPGLPDTLTLEDKWILSKFNSLARAVTDNLEKFELGLAVQKLYDFIWDQFCDWYIELCKARLPGGESGRREAGAGVCHDPDAQPAASLHALRHRGNLAVPAPEGEALIRAPAWCTTRRWLSRRRRRRWSG